MQNGILQLPLFVGKHEVKAQQRLYRLDPFLHGRYAKMKDADHAK